MRPAPTVTVTQLSSSGAASYEAQARPGIRLRRPAGSAPLEETGERGGGVAGGGLGR